MGSSQEWGSSISVGVRRKSQTCTVQAFEFIRNPLKSHYQLTRLKVQWMSHERMGNWYLMYSRSHYMYSNVITCTATASTGRSSSCFLMFCCEAWDWPLVFSVLF